MSNSINFNTLKKQYLTTTLPDEKHTTIMVCMPTKSLLDDLMSLETTLNLDGENQNSEEIIGELYAIVAKVMSRNKGGIKITREKLEKCLDFEDLIFYFKEYLKFVRSISTSKN